MTTTYVSMATARRAEEVQHRHRADKDGWCAHHLRHFHVRVRAGECDPWLIAQEIIVAYDLQQTLTLPESPVAGPTVPVRDLTHPGPPPVGRGGPTSGPVLVDESSRLGRRGRHQLPGPQVGS
ncbi:hypothetical protein GCM10010412_101590 [Nonomuraea recticatena]|uniref:Uncharacterized protein n=1 Tax=Nonomuraea recticatena TaxID=46178 RepID=A0ABN3TI41_9ACTN